MITDKNKIDEIFARGTVVQVLPSKEALISRMMKGERLRIYIGLDATAPALHLGHAKNIMFLEELRQMGHEVIILFGDFTAMIGDPTGKSEARKQLSRDEVKVNVEKWIEQLKPIISFEDKDNPAIIKYNAEWLSKLTMSDVIDIASNFTVQQMIERDMFEKRLKDNAPIHLHEFLYPLMQGYDSVVMDVDAELCGTDQIFNALAGRTLLERYKHKDKLVIALNLLANPKTGEMMSKSKGTGVFVNQSSDDMYGSIMSLPDPMIEVLYTNCTRLPMNEMQSIIDMGPRKAKAVVAKDIVRRFYGADKAEIAEKNFDSAFAKGGIPDNVEELKMSSGEEVADVLVKAGVVPSKTEWKRLTGDGAVRLENDTKIDDIHFSPKETIVLKIGKRRFVRIVVS